MATPVPGSTLAGPGVMFQWTGHASISNYWLYVGTTRRGFGQHHIHRRQQHMALGGRNPGQRHGQCAADELGSAVPGATGTIPTRAASPTRQSMQVTKTGSPDSSRNISLEWSLPNGS